MSLVPEIHIGTPGIIIYLVPASQNHRVNTSTIVPPVLFLYVNQHRRALAVTDNPGKAVMNIVQGSYHFQVYISFM